MGDSAARLFLFLIAVSLPWIPSYCFSTYDGPRYISPFLRRQCCWTHASVGQTAQSGSSRNESSTHETIIKEKLQHSSLQQTEKGKALNEYSFDTRVVLGGQASHEWTTDPLGRSIVNPPVWHASTVTFPNVAALEQSRKTGGLHYGRYGTPTTWALQDAFSVLEGADNSMALPSGLAAITTSLLAFLKAGDHLLVSDGVYDPTRSFCDRFLQRFGCETTYFDPCISAEALEGMFRANTRVLFLENPSSLTFELHDFEKLCLVARRKGAAVLVDNTYGAGIFKPLALGADVSIVAATKYIGGHSDLMLGLVGCRDHQSYRKLSQRARELGSAAAPDDCFLALRGLRTLPVRLQVARVLHPGLEGHAQHAWWLRDWKGSNGLFSFQFKDVYHDEAVRVFVEALSLFSIGYSWGGFESLVLPIDPSKARSAVPWTKGEGYGGLVRLHIGLESVSDLIADLTKALAAMADAQARRSAP